MEHLEENAGDMAMKIVPLADNIGVEVRDVGVKAMDSAVFGEIQRAWLENCVLMFRGQTLTPDELTAFGRRFGALEPPPASEKDARDEAGAALDPDMWIISNVIENGKAIGALGAGEAEWHSDMTYLPDPPTASILYGREVPVGQGNTWFASMYAAAAQLPDDLRRRIEGRSVNHPSAYTSAGELRKGAAAVSDVSQAAGAVHPMIVQHPDTGRPALYPGRRRNAHVRDLSVDDSETLLDDIWDWCVRDEFVYVHSWQPGDLLIWDNRSTLHRRDSFNQSLRRVLWRCQIQGAGMAAA
jgi:taurine dioxygenase